MILIFGGTTEGRLAAEVAEKAGKRFYYSTLDAAGQIETANGTVLSGEWMPRRWPTCAATRG